jgi:hypothetical protein
VSISVRPWVTRSFARVSSRPTRSAIVLMTFVISVSYLTRARWKMRMTS